MRGKFAYRLTISTFGLIAGALPLAPAAAQTSPAAQSDTGEIVVTAQRREERQLDVPISIATLGPQQLLSANVQSLGDISRVTPSVRFDSEGAFVQPSIRGIGTSNATSGGGSNVGIYIDGFYSPNPLVADFQLTKVNSIQVLKGPQGTLFGHNTTGGAILVTTAEPSEKAEADFKASYGSFNAQRYQGYATFGLTKDVAVDVEGILSKGNGFVTNIVNNDDHVGAYKNWTVRAGLKVNLSDNLSVLARYQHTHMDDPTGQMLNSNTDTSVDVTTGKPWGVQTFAVPGLYTTNPDQIASDHKRFIRTNSDIAQLTIKADLGFANLASYTQYRKENTDQSEDLDSTALPALQIGIPVKDETWTQELLLTSKPGPRLQWTAGFFFFNNKDIWGVRLDPGTTLPGIGAVTTPLAGFGGSGTTTRSYAAFVDATYQLADKLFLTAGVRYAHDEVVDAYWNTTFGAPSYTLFNGTVVPTPGGVAAVPSISSNHATPRVVIRYKPTDESSIYASYTRGYKAPIIDVGGSCQDGPPVGNYQCNPIKPENIDAYEIGYKFSNHKLSFEASAFYYNYRNLQVSLFLGVAQAYIINAAKSEVYGLDGEFHYHVNDKFQLNVGAAWTHGRYKQFGGEQTLTDFATGKTYTVGAPIYASCTPGMFPAGSPYDCAGANYVNLDTTLHGVHMQHMPDFTANAGASYTFDLANAGDLALSGNLYYTSSFYFGPSGTQFYQPGYATLGLRAQWTDRTKRYTLAVFGDNVTDERYRTQVQYNTFSIGAGWSAPASWGVEAGVKF